jgi:hypothetical protein
MQRIKILAVILVTFFVTFLIATAVTDYFARLNGFYAEGEENSRALGCGEY